MASVLRSAARRFTISRRNYATLLVAEHDNKALNPATLQAAAAAAKLPGSTSLDILVCGNNSSAVADAAAKVGGASRVLHVEHEKLANYMPDVTAELLEHLQKSNSYKVICSPASSTYKEVLPRLAAKLDTQPIFDIVAVGQEEGVFTRPMYAGNAISTVKSTDATQLLTFRPTAFEPSPAGSGVAIEKVDAPSFEGTGIEWLSNSEKTSDKPQLSTANRVISGGRGLKNGENFEKVLEPFCDKLGAAMGASRAAVDAGFVPNELQIGQTGKVVAPELYIAVGVSGAIQHLAGMKDSKTIVAINKDADAPIFQVSDYGLVADLFEAVPEIMQKV